MGQAIQELYLHKISALYPDLFTRKILKNWNGSETVAILRKFWKALTGFPFLKLD